MKCLLKFVTTAAIITAACYAGVKIYDNYVAKKAANAEAEVPEEPVADEPVAEEPVEAEDAQ